MGNNCCTVTVTLLKHLKGDNQPAQVEMVTLQQAATAAQRSFSGESNCQRKVFRSEKNHTMVTNKANSSGITLSTVQGALTGHNQPAAIEPVAASVLHSEPS